MTSIERIYRELPRNFTRQQLLKTFVPKGYSVSYMNAVVENLTHSGKAQRVGQGKYRKVD